MENNKRREDGRGSEASKMKYYKIKVVEGIGILNRFLTRYVEEALSVPAYQKSDFSPVWIPAVVPKERLREVLNESECFCSVKEKEKEDGFFPEAFLAACKAREENTNAAYHPEQEESSSATLNCMEL